MRLMQIITAKRRRETTRITLSCAVRAAELKAQLDARGFMTRLTETGEPVVRTHEEKSRATAIVNEVFGTVNQTH